jgi:predicted RNase H-like HicB family nuclease
MLSFIAIVRKEEGACYGVEFPDFPGCFSAGDTLEEARVNAHDALKGHLSMLSEDGDPIPAPSPLETLMSLPEYRDAAAFLVSVPDQHSVRLNISFPSALVAKVDTYAKARHMSRSAFLAMAANQAMQARP